MNKQLRQTTILVIFLLLLTVTVAACGTAEVPTSRPTTQLETNPTSVGSPTVTVAQATTDSSTTIVANPSMIKLPLATEVSRADKIFIAEVNKIEPLVWNTSDGKEPIDIYDRKYSYTPEQLAPVEFNIITSYKGSLNPGEKLVLFLGGAPGSKPYGTSKEFPDAFPKIGQQDLWFVGKNMDFIQGRGTTPLAAPIPQQFYRLQANGQWAALNGNTLTLADLEQTIKNPSPTISYTPRPVLPTPTPMVKPGQAVNLVELFELGKTQSVLVKGGTTKNLNIKDSERLKNIIALLNRPLTALPDPLKPEDMKPSDGAAITFIFANQETVGFEFNRKTGFLTYSDSTNPVKVVMPTELFQLLGL